MTRDEAIELLKPGDEDAACIRLHGCDPAWAVIMLGIGRLQLDGEFSMPQLEAMVTLCRGDDGEI